MYQPQLWEVSGSLGKCRSLGLPPIVQHTALPQQRGKPLAGRQCRSLSLARGRQRRQLDPGQHTSDFYGNGCGCFSFTSLLPCGRILLESCKYCCTSLLSSIILSSAVPVAQLRIHNRHWKFMGFWSKVSQDPVQSCHTGRVTLVERKWFCCYLRWLQVSHVLWKVYGSCYLFSQDSFEEK